MKLLFMILILLTTMTAWSSSYTETPLAQCENLQLIEIIVSTRQLDREIMTRKEYEFEFKGSRLSAKISILEDLILYQSRINRHRKIEVSRSSELCENLQRCDVFRFRNKECTNLLVSE